MIILMIGFILYFFLSLKVFSYDFRMICLRFLHGFPYTKASDREVENEGNLAEFQLIP